MGKTGRTHTVNYRKKTGKVKQHYGFLNKDTSTKPDKGTPIEIGESIMSVISKYADSPMNSFDMGFGAKFQKALTEHKKRENGRD